jgi:serine/threonine-protein kinase HipA
LLFSNLIDGIKKKQIHFTSAITMTGNNEDTTKENHPSYLDFSDFFQFQESNNVLFSDLDRDYS